MAWQEVETDIGAGIGRPKYSVSMKHGGARISLPKAIADKLGWSKTTRYKLLVGGGEQEGRLRLEAVDGGKISGKVAIKGGGLLIRLGRWPSLAPRDVDAIAIEVEVDKNALNVTLPNHARMVAPSARPATSIMGGAQPARDANGVPVGKVDVTDKFFNDPKPRNAMASGTRGK